MNDARPYASLSSGLLARKGAAKPAMRPQGYAGFEDLGWNDMGHAAADEASAAPAEHVPSSIAALTPAPKPHRPEPEIAAEASEAREEAPPLVAQRRAIAESFDGEEEATPEPPRAAPPAEIVALPQRAAFPAGRKAAFTLRLDAERHLRLRLASAVTGRSAQQLVTGALDAMLDQIPEIEALAARVPAAGATRS